MNRRAFFRLGGAAAIGLALDPERLLWVPGQKTYCFLPRPEWTWTGWEEQMNSYVLRGSWYAHIQGGQIFVCPSFVSGLDLDRAGSQLLETAKWNAYDSAVYHYRHA